MDHLPKRECTPRVFARNGPWMAKHSNIGQWLAITTWFRPLRHQSWEPFKIVKSEAFSVLQGDKVIAPPWKPGVLVQVSSSLTKFKGSKKPIGSTAPGSYESLKFNKTRVAESCQCKNTSMHIYVHTHNIGIYSNMLACDDVWVKLYRLYLNKMSSWHPPTITTCPLIAGILQRTLLNTV